MKTAFRFLSIVAIASFGIMLAWDAQAEDANEPQKNSGTASPAPATQPALTEKQLAEVDELVKKLDSDDFATREAAQKKLKEMGKPVVPALKDIAAKRQLSSEVAARIQSIVDSLNPPANSDNANNPVDSKGRSAVFNGGAVIVIRAGGGVGPAIQLKEEADKPDKTEQPASNPARSETKPASQPASKPAAK